jgi:alpha-1,6-mannosyltransferase
MRSPALASFRPHGSYALSLLGAGVTLLTILGPFVHHRLGSAAFVPLIILCGVGSLWAVRLSDAADPWQPLWIVLIGAVAMRLSMVFVENYFSSDIFRYVWDGRVQTAGINPYRYIPASPELSFLRDTEIFPNINRADYAVTIYPPAAQLLFLLHAKIGGSIFAMKLALLIFDAATIAILIAILRLLGRPPAPVAAYAWHPLPVWEIAVNGHVDSAMVALMVLGLWFALRGRTLLGGAITTIGGLVKPTALLALPVIWKPWDWRLPLVAAMTAMLLYLPYLSVGWGVLGFMPGYIQEEGLATGSGFWLLKLVQRVTGPVVGGKWFYLLAAASILAALSLRAAFRADRSPQQTVVVLAWLTFAFLFLLSPDYPWYFLPLVAFLPLSPRAAPWTLATLAFIVYDAIEGDTVLPFSRREDVLYGATLLALAFDLWLKRSIRATSMEGCDDAHSDQYRQIEDRPAALSRGG